MKRISASILALLLAVPLVSADKITLRNGDVLSGKIIKDKGETVLVEVNVTPSIRDQREISREDIQMIEKTPADAERFAEIKILVPTPDLLTAADYEGRLQQLDKFTEAYPESTNLGEIAEMRKTLEAEAEKVGEGSLKLNGIWIPAENQESNAYDFEAGLLLNRIEKAAGDNLLRDAVLAYEEMEEKVPNSSYQAEARRIVTRVLNTYLLIISDQKAQAPKLIQDQKDSLNNLEREVAERVKAELDREEAAFQAAYQRAKASGTKWLPATPYHPKELEDLSRQINAAMKQLAEEQSEISKNAGKLFASAFEASEEGRNLDQAEDAQKLFEDADPSEFYENIIERRVKALEAVENEEKLRIKEEAKAAKEAERDAKEAERAARDAKKNPPKVTPVSKKKSGSTSSAGSEKPKPAAPADEVEEDVDGDSSYNLGLMAGLGLVIILLIVFLVKQKKKKP